MFDRKKVISGLEHCSKRELCNDNCPYYDIMNDPNFGMDDCTCQLAHDTLELLKEQEPIVVYEAKISKCTCGNIVNRYYHPKFCGCCGKELMWY